MPQRLLQRLPAAAKAPAAATWLPAGTEVLTLDGALPVEYLCDGDRIVTRAGMRKLKALHAKTLNGVAVFALGFDAPEVIYADGEQIETAVTAAAQ